MNTPPRPSASSSFRALLVDDHPVTRAGTRKLLEQAHPRCGCGEASSLTETREQLGRERWDLMILDQNLPDGNGIEFLQSLPHRPPTLILTMFNEPGLKRSAIRSGAKGFATKSSSPERILAAIAAILEGKTSFAEGTPADTRKPTNLSAQEESVLAGILEGRRLTEIARDLGITPTTVQTYKNRLFAKFEVTTNAELVKAAIGRGLTEPETRPHPVKA